MKEFDNDSDFKLETPVFIKNSFILPIFDEIFSERLLNILGWFNNYISDNQLIRELSLIFSEIVQINYELLQKCNFNKITSRFPENYTLNLFIRKEFQEIDVNAKFNFTENYANHFFLTKHNEIVLGLIRRKIEIYWKGANDFESSAKLMFADRFLLELICTNNFMKENITNM